MRTFLNAWRTAGPITRLQLAGGCLFGVLALPLALAALELGDRRLALDAFFYALLAAAYFISSRYLSEY